MGKKHTLRHKARRKLEQTSNLCDNINTHLAEIAAWYEPTEKERFETMLEIGRIIEAAKTLMEELRKVL